MNAKHLIAAVAVLAATGSALAQEYVAPDAGFVSTKTRAEVIAELQQAHADGGALAVAEYDYPVVQLSGAPKTRDQVVAELKQARADGALEFDETSYPVVQASGTSKTREQVRAELVQHLRAHPYADTNSLYFGG